MNARIRHLRENVHIVCLVAMLGTSPWGHAADGAWEQAGYSAGGLFPVIVADPGIDILTVEASGPIMVQTCSRRPQGRSYGKCRLVHASDVGL